MSTSALDHPCDSPVSVALPTGALVNAVIVKAHWTMRGALALIALGALGTCVANVLLTVAAGRLGATRASVSAFLIPVVALVLGVTVRHEQVAMLSSAGVAICLVGAWILRLARA
jgi:drug/metabolite transporter (DMT)-like permease